MEQKFYLCEHCGKIVTVVKESGVPVMCCGQKMTEIIPGTTDAAKEKHIPTYTLNGDKLTVTVGSVEHPMTAEHYIQWISIDTEQGCQTKQLKPGDKPQVTFALASGDKVKSIYAYCNLHSLWRADYQAKSVCDNETADKTGDYLVCKCNKVSYLDIINEVTKHNDIANLLDVFESVKDTTRCSTGCGGCYDKVIAIISDTMNGNN